MPLIKEHSAATNTHDAIVLDLGDLRKQAQALKQQAHDEAARILAEARAEAERLTAEASEIGHRQGYERGHAEGLEAGRAAGREEAVAATSEQFNTLHANWQAAIEPWEQQRAAMLDEVRRSLLHFSVQFAAKVAKRTPVAHPEAVVDQVEAALEQLARAADAKVRLHPDDRPLIEEVADDLLRRIDHAQRIELIEDEAIERGGCIVTYGRGRVDATIDGQIERIIASLLPAAGKGNTEQDDTDANAAVGAVDAEPSAPGADAAAAPEADDAAEAPDGPDAVDDGQAGGGAS